MKMYVPNCPGQFGTISSFSMIRILVKYKKCYFIAITLTITITKLLWEKIVSYLLSLITTTNTIVTNVVQEEKLFQFIIIITIFIIVINAIQNAKLVVRNCLLVLRFINLGNLIHL